MSLGSRRQSKPALIVACWDRAPCRANSTHRRIKGTDNSPSSSAFISRFLSLNTAPSNFFQTFSWAFGITYWTDTAKAEQTFLAVFLIESLFPRLLFKRACLASAVVSPLSVDCGVLVGTQLVFNSGSCCLLLCRASASANFNKLLPLGRAEKILSLFEKHHIYLRKCCTSDCAPATLSSD